MEQMEHLSRLGILDSLRTGWSAHPHRGIVLRSVATRAMHATCRRTFNWLANRVDSPVLVLMYHRVTTLPDGPSALAVSPANFRDQIAWLRSRYPIVRLESDWSRVRSQSVAITFDDGFADNVSEALPILEELEAPATFFVTSGNVITGREFWWDELERLVLGNYTVPPAFVHPGGPSSSARPTDTPAARKALFDELRPQLKCLAPSVREEWMAALRQWAGVSATARPSHRPMDRAALMRLAASPFATVGAHTVSHPRLAALSVAQQREEIFGSKADLESLIGRSISVFAYPYGGPMDYTADTVRLVREAGFRKAVATPSGQAHRWTDPYQIPRFWMGDWGKVRSIRQLKRFWIL